MRKLPEGSGKRCQIAFRTTTDINAQLKAAAKSNGRSLAQELELRLTASFAEDRMRAIARAEIEKAGGFKKIFDHHHTLLPSGQWVIDKAQ